MKKRTKYFIFKIVVAIALMMFLSSCKKDDSVNNPQVQLPVVITSSVSSITQSTAISGGTISSDGGGAITARGICWGTGNTPTISDNKTTDGSSTGSFISNIAGLTPNTTYYVRAYATNSAGTGYGNVVSFSTQLPVLSTVSVTNVTAGTAICGGIITSDGGATVIARGVCWSKGSTPIISDNKTSDGTGTGNFTSNITGLTMLTTYYVRAYATTSVGTGYGNVVSFTTQFAVQIPVVTTATIANITHNSATCGGNITGDGGSTVTSRGVCWNTGNTPTISDNITINGSGAGSFISNITGLTPNTFYYIRAYATNSAGTGYGNTGSFKTMQIGNGENVTDIEGNVYHTVYIGTQQWMVENLRSTKYRSGEPITSVTDNTSWDKFTTGAYCTFRNSPGYATTYGILYNGYAVADSRKIAPEGWHIATDADWTKLTTYLGGESVAGGKLKEAGTEHWASPNTGATNETGFTALPGGYRGASGDFYDMGLNGHWWSSNENSSNTASYPRIMLNNNIKVSKGQIVMPYGYSIRCVRD